MKVVIGGAGVLGSYLAEQLSSEKHDIIVIDSDRSKLESLARKVDVRTCHGYLSDWRLLDQLQVDQSNNVLLAMTNIDAVNITASTIAKNLGYPLVITRVNSSDFLSKSRVDFEHIFDIDHIVCPEFFTAGKIAAYIQNQGCKVERFHHGGAEMRSIEIPLDWVHSGISLSEIQPYLSDVVIVAIGRNFSAGEQRYQEVIIPHGKDQILAGDHVTFIGCYPEIMDAFSFFGGKKLTISSVIILGGAPVGIHLAKLLSDEGISVRLVEKDYQHCRYLADKLPNTQIINGDGLDHELYREERFLQEEVFVSCTSNDEINLVACSVAFDFGIKNKVALLSTDRHTRLTEDLEIGYVLSPKIEALDKILALAKSERFYSVTSIYGGKVEILEINISEDSPLIGIPIIDLAKQLPKDFLIGTIYNRGRVIAAKGGQILSPGDTIICVANNQSRQFIENYL